MSDKQTETVTIESVGTATGTNSRGAWKRYDVKAGRVYKTFNTTVGTAAEGYVGKTVEIDFEAVEKDNGYTDFKLLAVRPANPAASAQKAQEKAQGQDNGSVPQEVWDAKDRRIVRQVCVKAVVELYAHREVAIPKPEDMLARAEAFERWIYRGMEPDDGPTEQEQQQSGGPVADDEDIPFAPTVMDGSL